jgi:carbamoyltransferase
MYTLGIAASHDASLCLLKDDEIKVALSLERVMRIKRAVPDYRQWLGRYMSDVAWADGIAYCLSAEGISLNDIELFAAVSPDPRDDAQSARLVQTVLPHIESSRIVQLPHPAHHLAHALASFYPSGFESAAALVVDCYGSILGSQREAETGLLLQRPGHHEIAFQYLKPRRVAGTGGEHGLCEIPNDLNGVGEIYRIITLLLGFHPPDSYYDDAGKTMGLASFGKPLDNRGGLLMTVSEKGVDCSPAFKFLRDHNLVHNVGDRWVLAVRDRQAPLSHFHRNIAAQIQLEFELVVLELARRLRTMTSCDHLVLGGGSFLNSVANTRIIREAGFKQVYIFPAATDDGTAVGAAFYALSQRAPNLIRHTGDQVASAYLGRSYSDGIARQALNKFEVPFEELADDRLVSAIAKALVAGRIIGWFQGRSEFGPRALGNRSILANPLIRNMNDVLNNRVKFREWFRPFAPAVPEEIASVYFDLEETSPFMLRVCDVRPQYRSALPAITHVDGSARPQTVNRKTNPLFHALLHRFGELTGVPVLLNTSFNVNHEPIVETPENAVECFVTTDLDAIVIGHCFGQRKDPASIRVAPCDATITVSCDSLKGIVRPPRIVARSSGRQGGHELSPRQLTLLYSLEGKRTVGDVAASMKVNVEEVVDEVRSLRRLGLVTIE